MCGIAGYVAVRDAGAHLRGLAARGLFRAGRLPGLLARYRAGRESDAGRLWALLVRERWFRRYAPAWSLGR